MILMVSSLEIIDDLKKFGFGKYEAMAYLSLVKAGIVTGPQLSRISGVPKSKIYDVIFNLVQKGAVEEFPGMPRMYKARTPDFIVDDVLTSTRAQISELEAAVVRLKSSINGLIKDSERALGNTNGNVLWTVNGRRAFHEKFVEIGMGAQKEVLVISPSFSRNAILERGVMSALKRGVNFYGITSLNPENAARVKFFSNLYKEMRVCKEPLPMTIVIADRKAVIYRMQYELRGVTNYIGVQSTNSSLVEHFVQHWQTLWKSSKKITPRDIDAALKASGE